MAASKPLTIALTLAALVIASTDSLAGTPITLSERQLDQVTAGLGLGVTTVALAGGGSLALTDTQANAIGNTTALPDGGFMQSGVAGGTAAADSPGGSAATGAGSVGTVNGNTVLATGIHGTVGGAGASLSLGFTFVTGGTNVIP